MRYTPFDTEIAMLENMTAAERMEYATTRMIECEEVWSLGDESGWSIRDAYGKQIIPIWPYQQCALDYHAGEPGSLVPHATSLENFVYEVLEQCKEGEIFLEVFPLTQSEGLIMPAADLFEILNGMLETNEYFIEG